MLQVILAPDQLQELAKLIHKELKEDLDQSRKLDLLPEQMRRSALANYLGISPDTISKWGTRGKKGILGNVHYLSPTDGYYTKSELIQFLNNTKK